MIEFEVDMQVCLIIAYIIENLSRNLNLKKASWLGICLATLLLSIQAQQAFGFYMVPLAPSPPACGGRGLGEGGVWGRSLAFCPHFQAALGNAMMLPFRYNPPLE
ncbi:MAG: hypothetical protein WC443_12940, partial [Desulfobaccales bacterium]